MTTSRSRGGAALRCSLAALGCSGSLVPAAISASSVRRVPRKSDLLVVGIDDRTCLTLFRASNARARASGDATTRATHDAEAPRVLTHSEKRTQTYRIFMGDLGAIFDEFFGPVRRRYPYPGCSRNARAVGHRWSSPRVLSSLTTKTLEALEPKRRGANINIT